MPLAALRTAYQTCPRLRCRESSACTCSRGRNPATRCHSELRKASAIRRTSGQPFPQKQPRPIDDRTSPDPDQVSPTDGDLADPLHAGTQARVVAFAQLAFDVESVTPLPRVSSPHHPLHVSTPGTIPPALH